jgi:hypothetical protein
MLNYLYKVSGELVISVTGMATVFALVGVVVVVVVVVVVAIVFFFEDLNVRHNIISRHVIIIVV